GEKDPAGTERNGFSEAKKALEDQGVKVETVNIASQAKVPEDANVVVLAGPTTEPFPQEVEFLNAFLNRGGGLLVMVDPQAPGLESFLKGWGVQVDNDVVIDYSGAGRLMGAGPAIPLVLQYESHKITERFRPMTFFPFARSVQPLKELPS